MERRGCGIGCVFATLGLVLGCLLLPYLISSIYSLVSAVFRVSSASTWLWGDWLSTILGSSHPLYMFLAEGPICCIGTVALLILILGVVLMITATSSGEDDEDNYMYKPYEQDDEDNYVYEPYEQDNEPSSEVEGRSTYKDQPTGIADQQ